MMDTAPFEPQRYYNGMIEGVTGALLADLYDLVVKFGSENPGFDTCHLHQFEPTSLYVSAVTREGNMNMIVSARQGGIEATSAVGILMSDPLPSAAIWDRSIGVDDVRAFIDRIDAFMRKLPDTFDPVTGERLRKPFVGWQSSKMKVDEFFYVRGKTVTVMGATNAEEMRQQFDRPEDVAIMVTGDGMHVLCRAEDEAYINRRTELILEVAAERYGVGQNELDRLTPDQNHDVVIEAMRRLLAEFD